MGGTDDTTYSHPKALSQTMKNFKTQEFRTGKDRALGKRRGEAGLSPRLPLCHCLWRERGVSERRGREGQKENWAWDKGLLAGKHSCPSPRTLCSAVPQAAERLGAKWRPRARVRPCSCRRRDCGFREASLGVLKGHTCACACERVCARALHEPLF